MAAYEITYTGAECEPSALAVHEEMVVAAEAAAIASCWRSRFFCLWRPVTSGMEMGGIGKTWNMSVGLSSALMW